MAQNTNVFVDLAGLLGQGSGHDPAAVAAPPVVDGRTALLAACRDDPARFQAEVLGRTLWTRQVAVCEAVAGSPITVVPAGRAVGKSLLLAGLVLWWVYTRPKSLVITTGPDFRQVVSVLWKELRSAAGTALQRWEICCRRSVRRTRPR